MPALPVYHVFTGDKSPIHVFIHYLHATNQNLYEVIIITVLRFCGKSGFLNLKK